MRVGVPTEIKTDEYRVAITPAGVREFVEHGHEVVIQRGAGDGSVIPDHEYADQGARIALDDHLVPVLHELAHARGRDRHAVLVGLYLGRDSNLHRLGASKSVDVVVNIRISGPAPARGERARTRCGRVRDSDRGR